MGLPNCRHCNGPNVGDCCMGALQETIDHQAWVIKRMTNYRSILINLLDGVMMDDQHAIDRSETILNFSKVIGWDKSYTFDDSMTLTRWHERRNET